MKKAADLALSVCCFFAIGAAFVAATMAPRPRPIPHPRSVLAGMTESDARVLAACEKEFTHAIKRYTDPRDRAIVHMLMAKTCRPKPAPTQPHQ